MQHQLPVGGNKVKASLELNRSLGPNSIDSWTVKHLEVFLKIRKT